MSISAHLAAGPDPASFLSLGELRQRIQADETLPPDRRRDMGSAVASFAKALGRPPELIVAGPRSLRPQLAKLTPAMVGHRPGRWRNILSLVTAALAHAGIVAVQGRIRETPSEGWLAVLRLLEPGAQRHFHLWRLARYATGIGVVPAEIDDALPARYQQDLEARSLVSEPARAARDAARYWNMAAAAHPGWPQQCLTVPDNRTAYAVPWEAFPASLRQEVEAWGEWLGTAAPFLERDFSPLRPALVAGRLRQVRLYLAALVHQGVEPAELNSLAAAVTPARAELGLRFFWEQSGRQRSHHAYHVVGLVLRLARHQAKLPAPDIGRLRAMADKLRPVAEGLTGRNLARLRQLQTAVAVEILIHVPMRLRNLQHLRLGVHLLRGTCGTVLLSVAGEEIKNGVPIEVRLPDEAARLIGLYLDRYRPLLAPQGGDWLFPGTKPGAPKTDEGLRSQIQKAIADGLKATGVQQKLAELEAKREALQATVGQAPAPPPALHPNLAQAYAERVADLRRGIDAGKGIEVLEAAPALFDKVIVTPGDRLDDPPGIELVGQLMAMLKAAGAFLAGDDTSSRNLVDALTSGSAKGAIGEKFPSPPGLYSPSSPGNSAISSNGTAP